LVEEGRALLLHCHQKCKEETAVILCLAQLLLLVAVEAGEVQFLVEMAVAGEADLLMGLREQVIHQHSLPLRAVMEAVEVLTLALAQDTV
jgi:hypothetical protein